MSVSSTSMDVVGPVIGDLVRATLGGGDIEPIIVRAHAHLGTEARMMLESLRALFQVVQSRVELEYMANELVGSPIEAELWVGRTILEHLA